MRGDASDTERPPSYLDGTVEPRQAAEAWAPSRGSSGLCVKGQVHDTTSCRRAISLSTAVRISKRTTVWRQLNIGSRPERRPVVSNVSSQYDQAVRRDMITMGRAKIWSLLIQHVSNCKRSLVK